MKSIVIYKSSTGFTKTYAKWIAEALSCEALPLENAKSVDLNKYDAVIFGGWIFAGTIQGLKGIKEKLTSYNGKKAVFATGATPPESPEASAALSTCFTEEERKTIGTFYMQGGLDYTQMGAVHKAMMKMMSSMMKKQKGIDSVEYKTVSQSFNGTSKESIAPLVHYITQ